MKSREEFRKGVFEKYRVKESKRAEARKSASAALFAVSLSLLIFIAGSMLFSSAYGILIIDPGSFYHLSDSPGAPLQTESNDEETSSLFENEPTNGTFAEDIDSTPVLNAPTTRPPSDIQPPITNEVYDKESLFPSEETTVRPVPDNTVKVPDATNMQSSPATSYSNPTDTHIHPTSGRETSRNDNYHVNNNNEGFPMEAARLLVLIPSLVLFSVGAVLGIVAIRKYRM